MSKYTISIKNLIKNGFNFGLTDYPIFDEDYRNILNENILYYYYEDEIGFETPELFKTYLNRTMDRIMPYYNNLYLAQKELIDKAIKTGELFNNVNYTEDYNRKIDSETNSNSNSKGKGLFQDTPQGQISMTEFDDQHYATNLTLNNNDSSDNTNGNTNEDYVRHIVGNNGNRYPVELLTEVRKNLVNIDNLVIDELKDLFMQIF
ncbi:MAG: hypothetical protein J6T10_10595 [Methanobrevibacter sp.]|nr:hypothetical protein [Methanobrevibacter sp.]